MAKNPEKKAAKKNQTENLSLTSGREIAKKIDDYEQTHPEQLSLFELLLPEEKKFSNTIELYDFIPKYHWGKVQRIDGEFLRSLNREFECRGKRYKVKIDPAKITEEDGQSRDCLNALEEMKANQVILSYKVDKTIDAKKRNKLLEAKFTITPDPRFADEMRQANVKQKQLSSEQQQ